MTTEELTKKVFDLDERVARHTEQIKTCFNQITDIKTMTECVHRLATSVETLALEQKSTKEKLDGLSEDVEEIKNKPAKRWEGLVEKAVAALVGGLIVYALSKIGLT